MYVSCCRTCSEKVLWVQRREGGRVAGRKAGREADESDFHEKVDGGKDPQAKRRCVRDGGGAFGLETPRLRA